MGRAMVEAMLLGKPVVVPRIYGIPEIVQHDQTGWLYDVGNVQQLADGIVQLLNDPQHRARLGANACELTRRLFDVRHMVAKIERIYRDLLPRKQVKIEETWAGATPSTLQHDDV